MEILGRIPDPTAAVPFRIDPEKAARPLLKSAGVPAEAGERLATWSGTSFAAPAVAGAIARAAHQLIAKSDRIEWKEALEQARFDVVEEPTLLRWSGLGTVVNVSPSYDPQVARRLEGAQLS